MLEQIKIICKKLASSEERLRLKGFVRLKKLLSSAESLEYGNALLIMKGLHYMLWMQDQPIKHEDVVDMICSLVGALSSNEQKLCFIKAFFETEAREWHTIDFWRSDKFMMLVRRFLKASFAFMQSVSWNDDCLQQLLMTLRASVVNHNFNQSCNDLKIHLADIICDELSITDASPETSLAFIRLFVDIVAHGFHKHHVLDRVEQSVLQFLLDQAHYAAEGGPAGAAVVNVNMEDLCQCLLSVGSDPSVKSPNRKRLFSWYKQFKNVLSDNARPDGALAALKAKGLSKRDKAAALARLLKQDSLGARKKKKKKKQQGNAAPDGSESASAADDSASCDQTDSFDVSGDSLIGHSDSHDGTAGGFEEKHADSAQQKVKQQSNSAKQKQQQQSKSAQQQKQQQQSNSAQQKQQQQQSNSAQQKQQQQQSNSAKQQKQQQSNSAQQKQQSNSVQQQQQQQQQKQMKRQLSNADKAVAATSAGAGAGEPTPKKAKVAKAAKVSPRPEAGDGQLRRSVSFGKIFSKRFRKKDRISTPTASGDEKTPERPILKKSGSSSLKLRSPQSALAARRRSTSPAAGAK